MVNMNKLTLLSIGGEEVTASVEVKVKIGMPSTILNVGGLPTIP